MKRTGFTMIELIFVIVILGILASVALPKLIGVKSQADEGLVKGFVGTLNRTVAPTKWSASIANGDNGSLISATSKYDVNATDTDFPASFSVRDVNTSKCEVSYATKVTAATKFAAKTTDGNYYIICRDGNASNAPKFWYSGAAPVVNTVLDDTKIKLP